MDTNEERAEKDAPKFGIVTDANDTDNPFWNNVKTLPGYILKEIKDRGNLPQIKQGVVGASPDVTPDTEVVYAAKDEVDRTPYVKVYTDNFRLIANLTSSELQLFTYVVSYCLKYDVDLFELDLKYYMKHTGTNRTSAYEAIKGLQDKDFIARKRHTKIFYYINPMIVFKGKRKRAYNSWVKEIKFKDNTNL